MIRILIHFGFHKTGTSTVEHFLLNNAERLSNNLTVAGSPQFNGSIQSAKRFSDALDPGHLTEFSRQWRRELGALLNKPMGNICVSSVDLIGRIPGEPNVPSYRAVPMLLKAMAHEAASLSPEAELLFHASTRAPEAWLKSLWWQNLKVHKETRSFEDFCKDFQQVADFHSLLQDCKNAIGDSALGHCALDLATAHKLGPAGPLLDSFDIPRPVLDSLEQQPALKVGLPDDVKDAFLEINRSELTGDALTQVKADLLGIYKSVL